MRHDGLMAKNDPQSGPIGQRERGSRDPAVPPPPVDRQRRPSAKPGVTVDEVKNRGKGR